MKKYHYTYCITEINSGKMYIGVRSSNVPPEKDLGTKYFSSSSNKEFIKSQKKNPSNYRYEVLSTFTSREEANIEEIRLHELYDVGINEQYLNRSKADAVKFIYISANKVTVKDVKGNYYSVDKDDPRYLAGELVSNMSGLATLYDENGNVVHKKVGCYDREKFTGITKNKVVVIDKEGNQFLVDKNDPRYLSGEVESIHLNKIPVVGPNGKIFKIDKNNPRYIAGKFQHAKRGYVPFKLIDGKKIHPMKNRIVVYDEQGQSISINIKDYDRSKYKSIFTDMINVKDENGAYIKINIKDYQPGNHIIFTSNKVSVKDWSNNKFLVDKNDPLIKTNKVIGIKGHWLYIEGEIHSIQSAIYQYKLSKGTIHKRCNDHNYPNWHILGPTLYSELNPN